MLENNLYKENYYALLACILNKNLSADRAVNIITKPKVKRTKRVLKGMEVTNIVTGKVEKYDTARDAAKDIGIDPGVISTYAFKQYTYKNMYKFKYLEK